MDGGGGMEYQLFNETDQLMVSPEIFNTKEKAEACAHALRQRFVVQGYYLTALGTRIKPEYVKLVVVLVD